VAEVRTGFECGVGVEGFNAFEVGDKIEFYVKERES
jgi:translation initiation factor IF-2